MNAPETEFPNFGGVRTRSEGDASRARVVFVQAPYEGTVSYGGGAGRGPAAILAASLQVETVDDETGVDLEDLSFALGPIVEPTPGEPPDAYAARVKTAVEAIAGRAVPFLLGGEHSVTIGAVRGVRRHHPRAHLLSIDAHADLRNSYGGQDHSHACVVRRLLEGGGATIVGVRSYSGEEAKVAARRGDIRLLSAREVAHRSFDVKEFVSSLPDPLYLTFDVDGLDPSVIPATGTPEPGGLGWWDALAIVREVLERRQIVGIDVVELAPAADNVVSDFAVARLVAKLLSYQSLGARKTE